MATRPGASRSWRWIQRAGALLVLVLAAVLGVTGPAGAVPPPPSNPSDADINAAQGQVNAAAGQVGHLANQLAAAQANLRDLQDDVELKEENANKALVDLHTAQDAVSRALADAAAARIAADAAGAAVDQSRQQVDQFAASSFAQGSAVGSMSAYIGSKSPQDLLDRQRMLEAISDSELSVLDQAQRARTEKANADSLARAALLAIQREQAAAAAASARAAAAVSTAIAARQGLVTRVGQLQAVQADLEQRLAAAQAQVGDLRAQRQQYQTWLAAKQAEDARIAAAGKAGVSTSGSASLSVRIATVIQRAMSELGVPYAWGGGTSGGPSHGVHDDGVADSYGDYNKIGFDCSGLMVYAFAGVGIQLPHYSGYQYYAGTHIPISRIQPGDMLFYGNLSNIHHVTLYLGGGMMIEAPESGEVVHVTPVRYDGLLPYATRMF